MKVSSTSSNTTVVVRKSDKANNAKPGELAQWWKAKEDKELCEDLLSTITFLKDNQNPRQRQAAIFARLYGNTSLYSFAGSSAARMEQNNQLPADRPTFNLVQSATDTLVSRIGQNRPAPMFLTDNGDYKQRNLAKKLNNFILGEFYQTKAYEKAPMILRDALVEGTGCLKVYEDVNSRVALERTLLTELFTDPNESIYGEPRQLYQVKLIDRELLKEAFPKESSTVTQADQAYVDNSTEASKTVSDLVMVVEAWRLPSSDEANDGRHAIACSSGVLLDEEYTKKTFPFVFLHYSPRLLGFWSQGLAEQLMGTQLEINSLLFTITRAIKLVGVPRVFVEKGSKIVKAHFNNEVGGIVEYSGTKPVYEVAPCVPQEMYAQLQRLIDYGYQQCGVSALQASSTKPAGLNSGEAIRSYDDISTDRFAHLSRKYDTLFIDLAYLVIDLAKDIAARDGAYQTVYPNKNSAKEIDLPSCDMLNNPFVIQAFNTSSLPKDPAGRMQKVTEMIQAGMISIQEGRRLLDYPDLNQMETLANASEERIFKILDDIVEDGKFTPPDQFLDFNLATQLTTQYINLYLAANLEEEKAQMLRDFFTQIQALKLAAMPPAAPPMAGNAPQANPEPLPSSPLIPNGPQAIPGAA